MLLGMEKPDETQTDRKRKRKFSPSELEVLVLETTKHIGELQQKNLNLSRKNAIWESIAGKVNAVGKTRRTIDEVKRRWQDLRRKTKEKMEYNKTSANRTDGGPVDEIPLSSIEKRVQLTFCDEEVFEFEFELPVCDTLKATKEEGGGDEEASEVWPEPPPSQPSTNQPSTSTSANPQDRAAYEYVDDELLQEQKYQTAELSSISQEVLALRQDTRAIAVNTRQLVSAVSDLTVAINALTRGIEDGVQAVVRSLNRNGHTPERPVIRRETSNLRKRRIPLNNVMPVKREK